VGPGIGSGITRTDLVEHIDVAAMSLAAARIDLPKKMQGQDILKANYERRSAVFAARDRCGEAVDRIRSVRTERYLYVRNFYSARPHLMPSEYKDMKLILQRLRAMHADETLGPLAEKLLFADSRPPEELYLYGQDRWQTQNLADESGHATALDQHRVQLDQWIAETGDLGPESVEVYTLETEDQMKSTRNKESRERYRRNSELYRLWTVEGK
jgi:arylsulfatase A-like enzyme